MAVVARSAAQLLSGGAFQGRPIARVPRADFMREMRRWGVGHLLVWSDAAIAYLRDDPDVALRWSGDHGWRDLVVLDADLRDVVRQPAPDISEILTPLGATVHLDQVNRGDRIVCARTIFRRGAHPLTEQRIPLFDDDGQLAFSAPRAGSYDVRLEYPQRHWLTLLALVAVVIGDRAAGSIHRVGHRTPVSPRSAADDMLPGISRPSIAWCRAVLICCVSLAGSAGMWSARSRPSAISGFRLDDGWIHAQFARNLASGFGLSFNPGEPSAGSTSPLWTAMVAAGMFCGLSAPASAAAVRHRLRRRRGGARRNPG